MRLKSLVMALQFASSLLYVSQGRFEQAYFDSGKWEIRGVQKCPLTITASFHTPTLKVTGFLNTVRLLMLRT